jgi:hypothetical protein
VAQARLRSSFIYLANAVSDLRADWATLAVVLIPLVLAASLCLLPDAINLQHRLASAFESGGQNVAYLPAQTPYAPEKSTAPQPYPGWFTTTLHLLFLVITVAVNLVVLVALKRTQDGARTPGIFAEAIEVYKRSFALAAAFAWVLLLQVVVTAVGILLAYFFGSQSSSLFAALEFISILVILLGWVLYLWLYFAQYALVFDGKHSWYALLYSRELMRKQFFRVAMRIIVFLAVWSGYNSWTYGAFVVVSVLIGPVGFMAGLLWATIWVIDLLAVGVTYATAAFFIAAGGRLYGDLSAQLQERAAQTAEAALPPTMPLADAQS